MIKREYSYIDDNKLVSIIKNLCKDIYESLKVSRGKFLISELDIGELRSKLTNDYLDLYIDLDKYKSLISDDFGFYLMNIIDSKLNEYFEDLKFIVNVVKGSDSDYEISSNNIKSLFSNKIGADFLFLRNRFYIILNIDYVLLYFLLLKSSDREYLDFCKYVSYRIIFHELYHRLQLENIEIGGDLPLSKWDIFTKDYPSRSNIKEYFSSDIEIYAYACNEVMFLLQYINKDNLYIILKNYNESNINFVLKKENLLEYRDYLFNIIDSYIKLFGKDSEIIKKFFRGMERCLDNIDS